MFVVDLAEMNPEEILWLIQMFVYSPQASALRSLLAKPFSRLMPDLASLPRKANVAKHVRADSPSQSGRQLLPLLKLPSTLRNEGN